MSVYSTRTMESRKRMVDNIITLYKLLSPSDMIDALNDYYKSDYTKVNLLIYMKKVKLFDDVWGCDWQEVYIKAFQNQCVAKNQIKSTTLTIPEIDEVRQKIRQTFVENDVRRCIGLIYCWWPLRDDLALRYLVDKDNCLLLNNDTAPSSKYKMTIRKSKVLKEPVTRLVPEEIANLIDILVTRNSLKRGDFLFGSGKKTWVIQRLLKKIGYRGSINLFRRMHRNNAIKSKNEIVIIETAKNSFHSLTTAPHYNSQINEYSDL